MATPSVPPLRIQKGNNSSSLNKMPLATSRPLSDLSPMAIRRNSPSFPQGKGKILGHDSSPAGSSPFSANANSPRLFWQGREHVSPARENRNPLELQASPGPAKRSSIENLKRASRVKNSGMFALEQTNHYDPSRPSILDGRPLVTSQSSGVRTSDALTKENMAPPSPSKQENSPTQATAPSASSIVHPLSPSKLNFSPKKSSLSKKTGSPFRHGAFDPGNGIWEDDDDEERKLPPGKGLHRHAKSVTFQQGPPQINEYEMTTPDPSSVASGSREGSYDSVDDEDDEDEGPSYQRGSSMDHDDSFDASLEDTDKTPVVMPEDWRFMSPETANTDLASHEEDVFEEEYGSPAPNASPGQTSHRPHQTSVNSVDSNGQARPLPPLPAALSPPKQGAHRDSLSGTLERMSGQRTLPSPPPAAGVSKSEIRRMSGSQFSMDDRLRLMMAEREQQKVVGDTQRERRMRRAAAKDASPVRGSSYETESNASMAGHEVEDDMVSHISREAILRHMRSNQDLDSRAGSEESDAQPHPSTYDPDVPIPSREDPTQKFHDSQIVKQEESEDDISSIPDYYAHHSDLESNADDDLTSQYLQPSMPSLPIVHDDGQDTPRASSPVREGENRSSAKERVSLPDFKDFGQDNSFDLGLQTYMTPPTEPAREEKPLPPPKSDMKALPDLAALRTTIQRPYTPLEQLEPPQPAWESDEPSTPDSVIHHSTHESTTPEIPEAQATVKAPGSNLKIRPSLTASEADSLQHDVDISPKHEGEQIPAPEGPEQSQGGSEMTGVPVSNTHNAEKQPRVSSLVQLEFAQDRPDEDLSLRLEKEFDRVVEAQKVLFERSLQRLYYPFNGRFPSSELPDTKDSIMHSWLQQLRPRPLGARPLPEENDFPLGEGFANRAPQRQRGYLMRQNTKVVVASERVSHEETRNAALPPSRDGNLATPSEPNEVVASPRKISQPTWTAEPWNGKKRRKSIRINNDIGPQKRKNEVVPPLPGQASAVQEELGAVVEDELAEEEAEEFEDGAERGRLFVKVIGVKDLQLPFPRDERTSFALTLDNGMHCVTTAWLDLAKDAPIGQEFELIVLNDLEFQLTLQMKLEEPKQQRPSSPSKPPTSPKKGGAFGRLFGSPKKKTQEMKLQEVKRPVTPPSFYELVQGLVAKDGSFARAYITLSEHEKKAYGRPYSVDIKCFNEWAMEEVNLGSSRSKKSVPQMQRRPPYEIGKLELLLMYVPKPKGAKDEDMPKSMNSAVRALREAEERSQQTVNIKDFEGHLSQQGGDCPYWRRRFFKLVGSKLTAYHEATLQPRATINLAKATKLIDDKSALTRKETSARGGGRRKSAFAEEEEGYMFVEEGFRIRFANGEVIDFYADSPARKEEWMQVLAQVVGKGIASSGGQGKGWTDMVLKREKSVQPKKMFKADVPPRISSKEPSVPELKPTQSSTLASSGLPLPTRPGPGPRASAGHLRTESYQQPEGGSRSQANSPVKSRVSREERYKKAKSMLL